jgi:hypothetical protein
MMSGWFMSGAMFDNQQPKILPKLLKGAAAGLAATVPMTLAMYLGYQGLPEDQRYPLPPRLITLAAASRVGVEDKIDEEPATTMASGAAHFGYGAFGGAVYAASAGLAPGNPIVKGSIFGLLWWAAGYLGWLPAFGLLSPATRHPAHRRWLMLSVNVLWSVVTALLISRLNRRK